MLSGCNRSDQDGFCYVHKQYDCTLKPAMWATMTHACNYRQHPDCNDQLCQCRCHVTHFCQGCGKLMVQGEPWGRCYPCSVRFSAELKLSEQHKRIRAALDEPFEEEARVHHARILDLIG